MSLMTGLVVAAAAASLATHAIASRTHFTSPHGTPRGMWFIRGLFSVGAVLSFVELAARPAALPWQAVVLFLYVVTGGLFVWAAHTNRARPLSVAYSPDAPAHLVTAGPYRYIRHPFYASYCGTWVAGATATTSVLLWIFASLMVVIYVHAARREERKFAASPLASAYRRYVAGTGMLLPRLRDRRNGTARTSTTRRSPLDASRTSPPQVVGRALDR